MAVVPWERALDAILNTWWETRMTRIFSYVITHDTGFAPNPFGGYCTLATCKPRIRTSAHVGDWLLGTGSVRGVGINRVVYAAKVGEVCSLADYGYSPRFEGKRPAVGHETWKRHGDNIYFKDADGRWCQRRNIHHSMVHMARDLRGKNVLIGNQFWYFGNGAPALPDILIGLVESGPGHRCEESRTFIAAFEFWLEKFSSGVLGIPFMSR